jgi:hypothetical protein
MWARTPGIPRFVNGAPRPWPKSKAPFKKVNPLTRVITAKVDSTATDVAALKVKI